MRLSKEHIVHVAQTIYKQLIYINSNEVGAWGSNSFSCTTRKIGKVEMAALSFKIRTPKVPKYGRVFISLDEGDDLYIVEVVTERGGKIEKIIGKMEGVYVDMLHDSINSLIEDPETMGVCFF